MLNQNKKWNRQLVHTQCGLCGSNKSNFQFNSRDYIYGNDGEWPVAKCEGCGVVFLNPRIPPNLVGEYYPKNYYTNKPQTFSQRNWKEDARSILLSKYFGYPTPSGGGILGRIVASLFGIVWSRLAWFRHNIKFVPNGTVLDVGCGNGGLLTIYKNLGWKTYGTEISSTSAQLAIGEGHEVVLGELTEVEFPDGAFDAITLWDALEHIHNPSQTMAEIFRICRPGGLVYVYVPNYASWYAKFFRDKWYMFTAPLHYYHYRPKDLELLLKNAGFRNISFEYPLGAVGLYHTILASSTGKLNDILRCKPISWTLSLFDRVLPCGHILAVGQKPI